MPLPKWPLKCVFLNEKKKMASILNSNVVWPRLFEYQDIPVHYSEKDRSILNVQYSGPHCSMFNLEN